MKNAIAVDELRKVFPDGTVAVDNVSFNVSEGSIFAFLGRNGAGKTTTVRMLTTLLRPSSGSFNILDYDVQANPNTVRGMIGVTMQEPTLDPELTGWELLNLHASLYGLHGGLKQRAVQEAAAIASLGDALSKRSRLLSGGMRRRLDLSVALVHRPHVLFLDEPSNGLDVQSRAAVWGAVRKLTAEGVTVFLTTQYLEEAEELASQIGIIRAGRLVAQGTPAELRRAVGGARLIIETGDDLELSAKVSSLLQDDLPALRVTRVGTTVEAAPYSHEIGQRAIQLLVQADLPITEFKLRDPDLHDVFRKFTEHG